ncbi:MAG: BCCT family transporter [Kofleriaceae bacterium]|nr:BCCT family transporter [Kofleriaceae bacterium]
MTKVDDAQSWPAALVVPVLLAIALLIVAAVSPNSTHLLSLVRDAIESTFGWIYLGGATVFLVVTLLLAFSSFGKRKLGPTDATPKHSRFTWFAMLLSAGTGVQFVYASVSEPLLQVAAPPFGREGPGDAFLNAMNLSLFHWGLHPWAVFALVAVSLGTFAHRRSLPLKLSSAFYPVLGERIHGPWGHVIDACALLATILVGISGLVVAAGSLEVGMYRLWQVPTGLLIKLLCVLGMASAAILSVALGLQSGIRPFSQLTLIAAGTMLLFVLTLGQATLVSSFFDDIWVYISYLPANSKELGIDANRTELRWLQTWTIPYWAWTIACAPSVGLFIAKISYGRTIREVVIAVVICPTILSSLWITAFANSAFYEQRIGKGMLEFAASRDICAAVFELMGTFPWPAVGVFLSVLCMVLFAITSVSSASFTLVNLSVKEAGARQRAAAVAALGFGAAFTLVIGGAAILSNAALVMALPICILLLVMCVSLVLELRTTKQ